MPPRHPSIARALGLVRPHLWRAFELLGRGPVLVACSGGADSTALLGLLHLLSRSTGVQPVVGHVDHGLRPSSAEEAEGVRALAAEMGLACEVDRLELDPGPGVPARARDARRAALVAQARRHGARVVALAHTATDQAETVLLHLSRGAGLPGLSGMAPLQAWDGDPPGVWLRPLLELTRAQTRELATRLHLPFFDDPTNDCLEHPRVAIRHKVLPVLREFRDRVDEAIAAAAVRMREADEALDAWVREELTSRRRADGWCLRDLDRVPRAVRLRWIREVCVHGGAEPSELSRRTLVALEDAASRRGGPARSFDLRPQRRAIVAEGRLRIEVARG